MALTQAKIYTEDDYYNLPENVRAELIGGNLIYNQAAPSRTHQAILGELYTVINNHIKSKGDPCRVYPAPFAAKLKKGENIVEPDISVVCDRDKLTDRGCTGAPDWILEIVSPGNPSHDYILKLNLYADAGAWEYGIVDPCKERIFVYRLEQEHFEMEPYTFHNRIPAGIYTDLQIDFTSLDF